MLPFDPQEEPWDQEMEVFGGVASSGEVSVVTRRTGAVPILPAGSWPRGLKREGAWGWDAPPPGLSLEAACRRSALPPLRFPSRAGGKETGARA